MNILFAIPLFAYLLLVLNLLFFTGDLSALVAKDVISVNLISGSQWVLTLGDILLIVGIVLLFFEMVKATRTSTASVVDHILSIIVFIVFLVEFLVVKAAGNSVFFILGLMSMLDVIAGFTITIVASRRDFEVGER